MIDNCKLHSYAPSLIAVEHPNSNADKIVLFVGGLGDSIGTVPFVSPLARELATKGWALAELQIQSSMQGWGTGSLKRDCADIFKAVNYFRNNQKKHKIVLMGHSTGSQDAIQYALIEHSKEPVDGIILQSSISDRQAAEGEVGAEDLDKLIDKCRKLISENKGLDVLPNSFSSMNQMGPINAQRFVALFSKRGDDDYFSPYLEDSELQNTFGKLTVPLLVLYSGSDEFVPESVDKAKLISRWATVCPKWSDHSVVVPGSTHNCDPEKSGADALNVLKDRVVKFVNELQ